MTFPFRDLRTTESSPVRGPFVVFLAVVLMASACQSPNTGGGGDAGGEVDEVTSATGEPSAAEDPTTNSLGMKFASVPGTKVLFSIWEVRRQDYDAFVQATGHPWPSVDKIPFRNNETAAHPAVNVSWTDATAFCKWLSAKERVTYRLPTDREWSVAAGLGNYESAGARPVQLDGLVTNVFPHPLGAVGGNYLDRTWFEEYQNYESSAGRSRFLHADGFVYTAPAGSFPPDGNGLHDLGGNVWEWCADKYGRGDGRVLRGASWEIGTTATIYASTRWHRPPFHRDRQIGFRVVREIKK